MMTTINAARGCQASNIVTFNYARPSITSVVPQFFGGLQLPLAAPSSGGFIVTIRGSNFGTSLPNVTIGGSACPMLLPYVPTVAQDTIYCTAPPGQGAMNPVHVTVNGLDSIPIAVNNQSTAAPPDTLWYDPPYPMSMFPAGECVSPLASAL